MTITSEKLRGEDGKKRTKEEKPSNLQFAPGRLCKRRKKKGGRMRMLSLSLTVRHSEWNYRWWDTETRTGGRKKQQFHTD